VVVYRVEGLPPGLYHYRPCDHHLTQLALGNFEQQVIQMNTGQFYSAGMAFGVYITTRFERAWWKYPASRAYRVVLLDIGHVAQTFQLVATALGLNTWLTAAFHDSSVHQFLDVDGLGESAIL
jgi:SagB-type dehydrogenase family enzyme